MSRFLCHVALWGLAASMWVMLGYGFHIGHKWNVLHRERARHAPAASDPARKTYDNDTRSQEQALDRARIVSAQNIEKIVGIECYLYLIVVVLDICLFLAERKAAYYALLDKAKTESDDHVLITIQEARRMWPDSDQLPRSHRIASAHDPLNFNLDEYSAYHQSMTCTKRTQRQHVHSHLPVHDLVDIVLSYTRPK